MDPLGVEGGEVLIIVIILALWLGLAYFPAWLARKKGYSFWLTFIVGLLAWWGTLPVFLIIKPKEATLRIPSDAALKRLGTHKTCYVCGKVNGVNAIHCRKCGMAFPFTNSSKTAVETMFLTDDVREEVNEGHIRVCQRCGRLNNPKRRVCKSCGAEFAV